MYLQITTKCNFTCAHCCYSCTMRGKHGDYNTIIDAISFARGYTENVSIGGGEPTLHPRFFDVLNHCLTDFECVWMATNGSQTETMRRLANIIDQEDYPECDCEEDDPEQFGEYGCLCHEKLDLDTIYQEDKLSVALSQDCFHDDKVDKNIIDIWQRRANVHRHSNFEIRDVSNHVIAEGRAKKTQVGYEEGCVCSDIMIKPDGKIKLCGCLRSPVIGDIWQGIDEKWERVINSNDGYRSSNCYKGINKEWDN